MNTPKSELTIEKIALKFQHYQTAKKLHELTLNESGREKEIKLLEFEQNEIKTAKRKMKNLKNHIEKCSMPVRLQKQPE